MNPSLLTRWLLVDNARRLPCRWSVIWNKNFVETSGFYISPFWIRSNWIVKRSFSPADCPLTVLVVCFGDDPCSVRPIVLRFDPFRVIVRRCAGSSLIYLWLLRKPNWVSRAVGWAPIEASMAHFIPMAGIVIISFLYLFSYCCCCCCCCFLLLLLIVLSSPYFTFQFDVRLNWWWPREECRRKDCHQLETDGNHYTHTNRLGHTHTHTHTLTHEWRMNCGPSSIKATMTNGRQYRQLFGDCSAFSRAKLTTLSCPLQFVPWELHFQL